MRAVSARRTLRDLGRVLLPPPVVHRMIEEDVDTLMVVPVAPISSLPLAALAVQLPPELVTPPLLAKVRARLRQPGFVPRRSASGTLMLGDLVDWTSVLFVPRLDLLVEPVAEHGPLIPAVVVGDPAVRDRTFVVPRLPGAREEAKDVASLVGVDPLLGAHATRRSVERLLRKRDEPALIYLATHGISSTKNPLDGSFLFLADGHWSAKRITRLRRRKGATGFRYGPLVVLSACQSGLGRAFDVGTAGLARAFIHAGAATVVMSLWNVDDAATRALMTTFITEARRAAPDQALRRAMLATRKTHANPLHWAAFTTLGRPLLAPRAAGVAPDVSADADRRALEEGLAKLSIRELDAYIHQFGSVRRARLRVLAARAALARALALLGKQDRAEAVWRAASRTTGGGRRCRPTSARARYMAAIGFWSLHVRQTKWQARRRATEAYVGRLALRRRAGLVALERSIKLLIGDSGGRRGTGSTEGMKQLVAAYKARVDACPAAPWSYAAALRRGQMIEGLAAVFLQAEPDLGEEMDEQFTARMEQLADKAYLRAAEVYSRALRTARVRGHTGPWVRQLRRRHAHLRPGKASTGGGSVARLARQASATTSSPR